MSTAGYAKMGMTASAFALAMAGLLLVFAPAETLAQISAPAALLPFVQVMGALYLGFAIADWTAKDSVTAASTVALWPSGTWCISWSALYHWPRPITRTR